SNFVMPKTAISGAVCGQINTRWSRKPTDPEFFRTSAVKRNPNAIALFRKLSASSSAPIAAILDW
ncbi:MAG: hypothetical protein P4K94_09865, partial [Terracidiphilus sp.]|nr:hypothetical protein [Terracidiphilus sp.]